MTKVALGEVATIDRTSVSAGDIVDGSRYVGLEHIEATGEILGVQLVASGELKSNKFRFTPNHVLFGKLRPNLGKVADPQFEGICSTDILPIQPGSRLDRRFLYHYLRLPSVRAEATRLAVGVNLPRLKPLVLAAFAIPLPPIGEQQRIAAVLDAADALRAKRRQAFSKLDTLTQAIFIHMFGDPVRNARSWPVASLANLGDLERGISKHRPRNDPTLLGGDWPLIQTGDVANAGPYLDSFSTTYSDLGLAQSRLWPSGTLCITIAANIAKTSVLRTDACFPDSVVGFTATEPCDTEYVRAFLRFLQPVLEAQAPESAQKNLNLKVLRGLQLPLPPLELRRKYARVCEVAFGHAEQLARNATAFDALFASVQQRAFRGEL